MSWLISWLALTVLPRWSKAEDNSAFLLWLWLAIVRGVWGFGHSKAREVPEAVRKATVAAKRQLIRVPLREGRTLHHDVVGRFGAGRVVLRAAPPGTGIIAGGAMRAIFECLGIQDVVAKSIGNNNPNNMVHAAFDALSRMESPRMVAQRRDKRVGANPCAAE